MWIAHKIIGGARCFLDNGWYYTWHHFVGKLGRRVMLSGGSRKLGHALLAYAHELQQFRYVSMGDYLNRGVEYKALRNSVDTVADRVAVFAVFTMDGVIPETTLYYLRHLREIADYIVCVGDCRLLETSSSILSKIVDEYEFVRHNTYDFGSYLRGLEIARACGAIGDKTDLILANDSCYGPVFSFNEAIERMRSQKCDFWGITANKIRGSRHIQSYFYYFKSQVVRSGLIDDFLGAAKDISGRKDAIENFEKKFTMYLERDGFVGKTLIAQGKLRNNPTTLPVSLLNLRCPLIKRKALNGESHESMRLARKMIGKFNPYLYHCIIKEI